MADIDREPRLRHEFVGMMFAVTIGEVGLQVAALVQAKHYVHFLPFYSHLLLATIVITSSWVGWSLSQAPGARQDVEGVFTWEFVTLLLDVFLVVTYFIIVRTIEVGKGTEPTRIDSSETVAWLMCLMFGLYCAWDFITKILAYRKARDGRWIRNCGLRMIPTLTCLGLALVIRWQLKGIGLVHYINADAALVALVLLFRSLKDLISFGFPRSMKPADKSMVFKAALSSVICLFVIWLGTLSAKNSWPVLSPSVAREIETPFNDDEASALNAGGKRIKYKMTGTGRGELVRPHAQPNQLRNNSDSGANTLKAN